MQVLNALFLQIMAKAVPDEPINVLSKDVQELLRKRKFPYPKSEAFLKAWRQKQQPKEKGKENEEKEQEEEAPCKNCETTEEGAEASGEKEKEAEPQERKEEVKEEEEDQGPPPSRIEDSIVAQEIQKVKEKLSKDHPSLFYVETPLRPEEKKKVCKFEKKRKCSTH